MSLYGALYSGVSGLTAQSSAMGAISDNITNVSTIGFKNTAVNFQTLVTKQTSGTFYSAGGVQSSPRQAVDVQGLLQASTSQTDLAISGGGFFVVNEANVPTSSDAYFYTRAGSFKQDSEGYLTNAGGYFLQGWPTDAAGNIIPADDSLSSTNLNVISNDYLETINLSRVAGSAAATTAITIGANLPADAAAGDAYSTDVQFFDTLGNPRTVSFEYTKSGASNQWNTEVRPPAGSSVLTAYDGSSGVYDSWGRLDFSARPADGSIITIDTVDYEFDDDGFYGGAVQQVEEYEFGANTSGNWTLTDNVLFDITVAGTAQTQLTVAQSNTAATTTQMVLDISNAINANATLAALITASASGTVLTITSDVPDQELTGITFTEDDNTASSFLDVDTGVNTTTTAYVSPTTQQVDVSSSTSVAADATALVAAVIAYDTDFTDTNDRIELDPDDSTSVLFHEDGTASISVDATGLLDSSGAAATDQTAAFTVDNISSTYADYTQLVFTAIPADGDTIIINGISYSFQSGEAAGDGDTVISTAAADIGTTVQDLEDAIETNDPNYPAGDSVRTRSAANSGEANDTLVIHSIAGSSFDIDMTGITTAGDIENTAGTAIDGTTVSVSSTAGLIFDSLGLPSSINVQQLKIAGFSNGAADMDDVDADRLTIDFGTTGQADGMTQFGSEFTPTFITQNGSRFGSFAGVSISPEGEVTALFDNGDTRTIYQIPIATFVNPNGLESRTGNVWNASEGSGDYTLRTAGNGPAGVVTQGSLEASTVDIGEEFTSMIVVQRAYSAATKIISTADQMLEELMRTKR